MKKYLCILLVPVLFACNQSENKTSLTSTNGTPNTELLVQQLQDRDSLISDFLKAFDSIQNNLNIIKSKEHIITVTTSEKEISKPKQDQIIEDIQTIYSLLKKNRKTVAALQANIHHSKQNIGEMTSIFQNILSRIYDQEAEIVSLKDSLSKLHTQMDFLSSGWAQAEKESEMKTDYINTGYCAIGTHDGLIKEGVIVENGGVIGIGKVDELNSKLSKNLFSSIDIYKTREISMAASEVKILSNHPKDSYRMEGTKLQVKKLTITDPDAFWSTSKYLIIEVSADQKPENHPASF